MSYRCAITGKRPQAGKQISHSHRVTGRRFMPNLQKVRVMTSSGPKRLYVSAKAIKSCLVRKVA